MGAFWLRWHEEHHVCQILVANCTRKRYPDGDVVRSGLWQAQAQAQAHEKLVVDKHTHRLVEGSA